jgi:hypothetical protein
MKSRFWKCTVFFLVLNLKYIPRLLIAPFVGLYRGMQYFHETMGRMDAEFDAFVVEENQRAERNPTRSFNA